MKNSHKNRNRYPNKQKRVYRECTPEEYDHFLATYPRPLERHLTTVCEPMQISYNDFTMGSWPDSMVAVCSVEDYLLTDETKFRMNGGVKESGHRVRVLK